MTKLPEPQRELLGILQDVPPGRPMPSLIELARRLGLSSTSGVQSRLSGLAVAGEITWEPGKARSIRVLRPGCQWVSVPQDQLPVVESVLAGPSADALAVVERWVAEVRKAQRAEAAAEYRKNGEIAPL